MNDFLNELKLKCDEVINSFEHQITKIRTGRANPSILDDLKFEYFNELTPIAQMAAINVPEPQQLVVKPYDRSAIPAIQSAILKSNLNLNPQVEADLIRIKITPLTEEVRKDLVKKLKQEVEEFKVRIRNERRHSIESVKKDDSLSEDMVKGFEKDVQKVIDATIVRLENLAKAKENQLMQH